MSVFLLPASLEDQIMKMMNNFRWGTIATYPLAGGRRETHRCIFQGRKMHGVATNVYLRKTSEKPERCGLQTLIVKGSGVVFTHGEGISTLRVCHKGQQPLTKCAISCLRFVLFSLFYVFYVFLCLLYFFIFFGVDKGVSLAPTYLQLR